MGALRESALTPHAALRGCAAFRRIRSGADALGDRYPGGTDPIGALTGVSAARGAGSFLTRPLEEGIRTIGPGTKEPVFVAEGELRDRARAAKKGCFFMRYRWFESISLQRRVGCEPAVLTIEKGRFTLRRARLAPAMISTPGHRASRRRQRGACQPGRYSGSNGPVRSAAKELSSDLPEDALDHADGNPVDLGDLGNGHSVLHPGSDAGMVRPRDLMRGPGLGVG